MCVCMYNVCMYDMYVCMYVRTPLAQRVALHSSLFGSDDTVNYDYIFSNSIIVSSNDTYVNNHC